MDGSSATTDRAWRIDRPKRVPPSRGSAGMTFPDLRPATMPSPHCYGDFVLSQCFGLDRQMSHAEVYSPEDTPTEVLRDQLGIPGETPVHVVAERELVTSADFWS